MLMGETRINLKHLLEDIRDNYPISVEEVIITELVANALDSGAFEISMTIDKERKTLSVADNGKGMTTKELRGYHDIASTTKKRGTGIGFAGIGAKLALLIAETVVTETRNNRFYGATTWYLKNPMKAPWAKTVPQNLLPEDKTGTLVTIYLNNAESPLLEESFVKETVQGHFYPLFKNSFDAILKLIYKQGIRFLINGQILDLKEHSQTQLVSKSFFVRVGKQRHPIGIGFLAKFADAQEEKNQGIAISTYGKVIKRGWEWLGLAPRDRRCIAGAIEIPTLSKILTTNKADFLRDKNSLRLYYQLRRAIQSATIPILQEFGEDVTIETKLPGAQVRPMEKEMSRVLGNLIGDFPELATLVGWKPSLAKEAKVRVVPREPPISVELLRESPEGPAVGVLEKEPAFPENLTDTSLAPVPLSETRPTGKKASLTVGFAEDPSRKELGWLLDNTIWINRSHPAHQKAKTLGQENYHLIVVVAWVLAEYLGSPKSQREFLNRFLTLWGFSGI